jgi:hypothetical protein
VGAALRAAPAEEPVTEWPGQKVARRYCDGHSAPMMQGDLMTSLFLANGNTPTFP